MRGWLAYIARARGARAQVEANARLARHVARYRSIPLVGFDAAAAEQYDRLVAARVRVRRMDPKIASIALAQKAVLLTRNRSDFEQIPGLRIDDWTV